MEQNLKVLLYKHGVTLKKAFGQNFLTDESLLDEIVEKAGVTEKDVALEIGCGAGALTRALAKKAKKVIGYEIDKTLKPILEEGSGLVCGEDFYQVCVCGLLFDFLCTPGHPADVD